MNSTLLKVISGIVITSRNGISIDIIITLAFFLFVQMSFLSTVVAQQTATPLSFGAPANDNFANASGFISTGGGGFILATNVGATSEAGEPIHGAGTGGRSSSSQNSVWYRFTAYSTRVMVISTSAGGTTPINDTVLSAYSGTALSNLTPVAENDDYPGLGYYSKITFGVVAGQIYYIAVDGSGGATGTFYLSYKNSNSAANNNFSNAEAINYEKSPYIGITGSTIGATGEVDEPNHAANTRTINSIWYSWTAPANLSMTFTTAGSNFDTTLSVYTGSSVNSLTLMADDDDDGPGNNSRVTFIATSGTTYRIAIEGVSGYVGNTLLNWNINRAESSKQFDFDGDLKTDFAVYRPNNNTWYILKSSTGGTQSVQLGQSGDVLVPGLDYEGDDKADIGFWRPSNGVFNVRRSSNGLLFSAQWGQNGDFPLQGDFDGDDRSDFAVWRPSDGTFYVFQSSFQSLLAQQWGQNGDKPAPGDYDGDGRTDFAVWRPSDGFFYIFRSSDNTFQFTQLGTSGDLVVPGDYDRDGKNDIAVYRPGNNVFYVQRSSDGAISTITWGVSGDLPAPGDYDGNGYTDFCVWRPLTGVFDVLLNPSQRFQFKQFGQNGDLPVANSNVH